jgi:hypothetical protein
MLVGETEANGRAHGGGGRWMLDSWEERSEGKMKKA